MKKSLILSLLLSSLWIAKAVENENEIKVETHLTLIGNGIIITPDESGVVSDKIALDHGTKKDYDDSKASRVAYIKSPVGNLPAGLPLQIDLTADRRNSNDLVANLGEKDVERIAHRLSGVISNAESLSKSRLEIAGGKLEDKVELTTTGELLTVTLNSDISGSEMMEKETGNYENTSTMAVKVLAN